jgi:solute carrier family 25 (mitochondrial carnitine/acylcarnitine transporter), member 20/29
MQATCALMNGLVFASYRFFMKIQLENDKDIPTIAQIALAGAGSGIVSSCVPIIFDFVIPYQLNKTFWDMQNYYYTHGAY